MQGDGGGGGANGMKQSEGIMQEMGHQGIPLCRLVWNVMGAWAQKQINC
jgi:hypothetical protein